MNQKQFKLLYCYVCGKNYLTYAHMQDPFFPFIPRLNFLELYYLFFYILLLIAVLSSLTVVNKVGGKLRVLGVFCYTLPLSAA